ncbi:MAG: hypothetical protein H0T53_15745 [Herpetosiphonaceae bacterium]|nr:hypothetical protein [Herpetosiphonaceae bacterium]
MDELGAEDGYIMGPGSGSPVQLQRSTTDQPELVLDAGLSKYTFERVQ